MATPQAGNQHNTLEMELVFAEFCDLLKAADLRLKGLFLNADKAFDVSILQKSCVRYNIEATIPFNGRSADCQTDDDTHLDPNSTVPTW